MLRLELATSSITFHSSRNVCPAPPNASSLVRCQICSLTYSLSRTIILCTLHSPIYCQSSICPPACLSIAPPENVFPVLDGIRAKPDEGGENVLLAQRVRIRRYSLQRNAQLSSSSFSLAGLVTIDTTTRTSRYYCTMRAALSETEVSTKRVLKF